MNYVGHAWFAEREPIALLGNLLGDFVKGPLPGELDPELAAAVAEHRAIDAFCDRHAAFRASRQRLFATHSHYAGPIVDVLFDHLLCADWERYADESLDALAARAYAEIARHRERLPARVREHADTLVLHDVLRRYRELDSVREALRRMSGRLRRPVDLASSLDLFVARRAEFAADFRALFDALQVLRDNRRP